jgi:hypothetical protein
MSQVFMYDEAEKLILIPYVPSNPRHRLQPVLPQYRTLCMFANQHMFSPGADGSEGHASRCEWISIGLPAAAINPRARCPVLPKRRWRLHSSIGPD